MRDRVHAAVLICVKTAAILGAILALGPLKEKEEPIHEKKRNVIENHFIRA